VKLVNPLYYPAAVLAGVILLVVGVRWVRLPNVVILPMAIAATTLSAIALKSREPEELNLDNPALEHELLTLRQQANDLALNADTLQQEATRLLTNPLQMDLLGTVQYACDRAKELPQNLDGLMQRLQGKDALLSLADLQSQLADAQQRLSTSRGATSEHLNRLVSSLQRNIELTQQGTDARQAQVLSLSTLIQDAAGSLQALQNKLRTVDLSDTQQTLELKALSDTFQSVQEDMNLLVSR
jgi:hypothetical protein